MQLFVICVLLLRLYYDRPRVAITLMTLLLLLSVCILLILSWVYDLHYYAVTVVQDDYLDVVYNKPYCRSGKIIPPLFIRT